MTSDDDLWEWAERNADSVDAESEFERGYVAAARWVLDNLTGEAR